MKTTSNKPTRTLVNLFNITVLTAYFHAFMEWIFFVTQSSSLSILPLLEKVNVFFVTGGLMAFVTGALLLILLLPGMKWKWLLRIPAALMLSVSALILLDNFTYTVFGFGIVSTPGLWRLIYTAIFLFFISRAFVFIGRIKPWKFVPALTISLLAVSSVSILSIYTKLDPALNSINLLPIKPSSERPNIIIIGGDGLSASYLSAYGFKEATTPFLEELVTKSLFAENAYPNVSSTTASTTSALTGKEAAEVKVYRYPDILADEDSFEHLPGILKNLGYQTVEIGTKSYVDAAKVNLVDGFEYINGQTTKVFWRDLFRPVLGNSPSAYFIQIVAERMSQRLLHIFFIRDMDNPFQQVNNPAARLTDTQRTLQIINLLAGSERPVFVFAHYMNTHGPHFSSDDPAAAEASLAEEEEWDVEKYKLAIQTFDKHIGEIYAYLENSGKLDNTILVIYTDHGYRYSVNQRIPIIMHFPNGEHAGPIRNNAQIIDIPVTLLDYLGLAQPEWMTGTSLLGNEPPSTRQIISITAGSPKKIKPPFYQIKSIQIIVCQKWYSLNVQDVEWKIGEVKGHTSPCDPALLPSDEKIRQTMVAYLETHGYDVGTIK